MFAVDDETMEHAVLQRLEARGWTLGGRGVAHRRAHRRAHRNVPGASRTFRGSIASYATEVKQSVLGVTTEHVVSEECASRWPRACARVLGADVGIAATGVAGPDEQDGQPVGTVWFAIALPGQPTEAFTTRLPGDRERVRQFSTISLLNVLRMRLDASLVTGQPRGDERAAAFLAVVPPPAVLDAIDALLERPKSSRFGWTQREQWHVTMQFFGRVDDSDVLVAALAPASRRPRGAAPMHGGGAFPAPKKARVFWLGVENGDTLLDLHADDGRGRFVHRAGATASRSAAPHARPAQAHDRSHARRRCAFGRGRRSAWTATELVLFESETRRRGAVYSEIARLPLAVPARLSAFRCTGLRATFGADRTMSTNSANAGLRAAVGVHEAVAVLDVDAVALVARCTRGADR